MAVEKSGNNSNENQNQHRTTMDEAFATAGAGNGEQAQKGGQGRPNQNQNQGQNAAPGSNQNQGARSGRRSNNIMNINSLMRRPVSRKSTGADVQAFVKELNKKFETEMGANYRDHFSVMVFDGQSHMTPLSSILLTLTTKHNGADHAIVFNLVIETSGGRLNPRYYTIGQQTIEIESVAGDVVDQMLWDKIRTYVQDSFGRQLEVHYAGALVLPSELSPEDADHMHRVFYVATQALYTVMENDLGTTDNVFTIGMVDNTNLSATLDYNPAPADTATTLPIRDDLSIILRADQNTGPTQGPHERGLELTRVDAFIDLKYAAPQQQAPFQPPVTQRYYPMCMITRLDTELDAVTPELALLALASATMLAKNGQWATGFLQRYGVTKDLRDIGAVGYEVNLSPDPNAKPERITTKGENFGQADLMKLIGTVVHDNLSYGLYVEETGELSWLHSTFLEIARGNAAAYKAIVDAANNLTGGAFGTMWQGGPICTDDNTRVALGYYVAEDGSKHDIRDIDYLAMLNIMGDKDMSVVAEFSDTFLRKDIPSEMRLETRNKLLRNILRGEMKIKGYAQLITFSQDFMNALMAASAQAGLSIRQNNTFFNLAGQTGRGSFEGQQYGVNSQAANGLFSFGQQNFSGFRGGQGPANRWTV